MSKKDLRNGKEWGRWNPHKWSDDRARRARTHALNVAYNELCADLGQYQAALQVAEIYSMLEAGISRAALRAAGVPTIGA